MRRVIRFPAVGVRPLFEAQESVISGYIPVPHGFDSLIVGYYRGKDLMYVAQVRSSLQPGSSLPPMLMGLREQTIAFALPERLSYSRGQKKRMPGMREVSDRLRVAVRRA